MKKRADTDASRGLTYDAPGSVRQLRRGRLVMSATMHAWVWEPDNTEDRYVSENR